MKQLPRPILRALGRRHFVAIAVGALILAACQSSELGTNPSAFGALARSILHRATGAAPTFTWQPYTYGGSNGNTVITGINNHHNKPHLVFVSYHQGALNSDFVAALPTPTMGIYYTPEPPTPEPPNHSPADVYLAALSNHEGINSYSVGYLPALAGNSCTYGAVCGFIYDPAASTQIQVIHDSKEGTGTCAQTYLYGTDNADIQVGYYTTGPNGGPCVAHAVEEYSVPCGTSSSSTCPQFVDFQVPWSATSSKAYGINDEGYVVGSYTVGSSSSEIGWELRGFAYCQLEFQNTLGTKYPTEPRDIAWDSTVVGSYQNGVNTYGFVYRGDMYYQENYSNSPTIQTAVYGTNDTNYLVGAYLPNGSSGSWNGFIGTCQSNCGSHQSFACQTPPPSKDYRRRPVAPVQRRRQP